MQVPLHSLWISHWNDAPGFSFSQRCAGFHPIDLNSRCQWERKALASSRQPRGSPCPEGAAPARGWSSVRGSPSAAAPELRTPSCPCSPLTPFRGTVTSRLWGQRSPPAVAELRHERPCPAGPAGLGSRRQEGTNAACPPTLRKGAVPVVRVALSQL